MTNQNKFAYLLTTQSVTKNVAQFIVDAFDDTPVKMWAIKILGPYFNVAGDAIRPKTDLTLETNRKSERKTTEKHLKP